MDVKTIAVIGAGAPGRSIARTASLSGYKTILEDISSAVLEDALAEIKESLDAGVVRGGAGEHVRDAALANLSTASTVEDAIREADLIIETVAEEMELKIELFTILDKFARPNAIFASTSASLSITEMAEVTFCAERCIGMRFVYGASSAEQMELVQGLETSRETVAICREVGRRLGKEVVVTQELARGANDVAEQKAAGAHN